jgi:hypothetical protein
LWSCVRIRKLCSALDEIQEFGADISPGDVIPATDHV